jgi:hypothetical protein
LSALDLGEEGSALISSLLSLPASERFVLPPMSPERQKQRTLETLLEWILAGAARQPLMLLFEDLHWVDPSTVEWLNLLVAQVPTTKILLLLTVRPSFRVPWAERSHVTALTLNRFTRRQTESMVTHLANNKSLPQEVFEQIVTKTDGVPLFVEELTKMVLESALLKQTATSYELTGPLPPLAIPSTLQDSLMARLDRLATVKQIAQLAATLGRAFPYQLLKAVANEDEAALDRELAKLVEAEILYQKGLPPQATYVFKHALIQDAAYQSLLKSTRHHYHQRVATAMVDQFAEESQSNPEFVAHHFSEAGMALEAMLWWQRAGERAYSRAAAQEAIGHYRRGLLLVASGVPSVELDKAELNLWIALGNTLIHSNGWSSPESVDAFDHAERLSVRIGDPAANFRVTFAKWAFFYVGGNQGQAHTFGRKSLSIAQEMNDRDLLINAHSAMGHVMCTGGNFATEVEHLEQAITLYGPSMRRDLLLRFGRDPKVSATQALVWSLWSMGYLDQVRERASAIFNFAMDTRHPFMICWGYFVAGFAQVQRAVLDEPGLIETGYTLAVEQGFPFWIGFLGHIRGVKLIANNRFAEDIEVLRRSIATLRATGCRLYEPLFASFLARGHRKLGDVQMGKKGIAEGLALMQADEQFIAHAPLLTEQGELFLAGSSSDANRAEECFLRAIDVARSQQAKLFELRACVSLARLWHSLGKHTQARELLAPVYGWFTEGLDTPDLEEAKALLQALRERPYPNS